MRKVGILVIVGLLAVTGIMAAMAYSKATVESSANLAIVNTDQALLQLRHPRGQAGVVGSKDATYSIVDGQMFIQFGMGVGRDGSTAKMYGLQPNSTYEWNPLFTIANMSAETLDIKVSASGEIAEFITFGNMGQIGGGVHAPIWGEKGQPLTLTNVAKESGAGMQNLRSIAVRIELDEKVNLETLMGKIIVEAVAK